MSKAHWLALASVPGLGSVTLNKLLARFGDVESIFSATPQELAQIPRITPEMADKLLASPLERLEDDLYALSESEIDLLTWDDPRFPVNLRALPDKPVLLFASGRIKSEDAMAVAIVGTRAPTVEGLEFARRLGTELAARGLTVTSGLALGIDTAAHLGALQAEEGRTIAVLGSGILNVHPRENAELARRIVNRGAVLSELMPGTPPRGPLLMARDRITSGLSRAVIVIEAGSASGSLDTARRAEKQGRLVYAVPGSPGTDGLLRTGAKLVDGDTLMDVLAEEIHDHSIGHRISRSEPQQRLF